MLQLGFNLTIDFAVSSRPTTATWHGFACRYDISSFRYMTNRASGIVFWRTSCSATDAGGRVIRGIHRARADWTGATHCCMACSRTCSSRCRQYTERCRSFTHQHTAPSPHHSSVASTIRWLPVQRRVEFKIACSAFCTVCTSLRVHRLQQLNLGGIRI